MGMRINTNVISLTAQRNLGKTQKGLQTSLTRLSSGYRINSARDDAAGLAISEGLTAQVRGLNQAIRNANDGIGFLMTAEGAMAEDATIFQRIRELAIQSSSGTLSADSRSYLNLEAQALISEVDRIATQTDFNGVKLLDGSFQTTALQVGTLKGRSISFGIGNARTNQIGAVASISGAYYSVVTGISTAISGANLKINGYFIGAATNDGTSYAGTFSADVFSAIAIARAVNNSTGTTGVTAYTEVNQINLLCSFSNVGAGTINSGDFFINNVGVTGSGVTNVANLVTAINNVKNQTGVVATADASVAGQIDLQAADGRNIVFTFGTMSTVTAQGINSVFNISQNSATAFGTISAGGVSTMSNIYNASFINVGRVTLSSSAAFTVTSATATSVSNMVGMVGGASLSATVTVNTATALNSVDISTITGAQNALNVLDNAMKQISGLRAALGATSNRLQSTISNLGTVLENLSSANSQIKDTDVSSETAELTRQQVLQQAGISVLQQANISSQVALTLLRF